MINIAEQKARRERQRVAAQADPSRMRSRLRKSGSLITLRDLSSLDLPSNVQIVQIPGGQTVREFDVIVTPEDGIWGKATFKFHVNIPENYPIDVPGVHCMTQIWHPNINTEGKICLNILRDREWAASLNIQAIIFGLIFLFHEPNTDDPLNFAAADEMKADLETFKNKVKRTFRGGRVDGYDYERMPNF